MMVKSLLFVLMLLSFNTIVFFTITNSTVRLLIRIAFKTTTRGRTATTNTATVHDDQSHHSSYFYVSSFSQWTERTAKRRKKVGKLLETITFPTEMITTDHRMNNNLPIQIGSKYYSDFLACSSSTTMKNTNENATVDDTEETAATTIATASTELPLLRLLRIPVLTSAPELDWNTLHPSLDPHASISRSSSNNNNTSSKSGRKKIITTTTTATTNPTSAVITPRAQRKRRAVEAFYHIIQTMYPPLDHTNHGNDNKPGTKKVKKQITILDAASGAGGLTVPLAGLLASSASASSSSSSNTTTSTTNTYRIVAIDMNAIALQRLKAHDTTHTIETICADLATFQIPTSISSVVNNNNNNNSISSDTNTTNNKSAEDPPILICSLHGCGAVTDFAIDIATRHRLPFCVSSCCTAKAITKRQAPKPTTSTSTSTPTSITKKGRMVSVLLSSKERSAAPAHITYPRSDWLQQQLLSLDNNTNDTDNNNDDEKNKHVVTDNSSSRNKTTTKSHPYYSTIAKVADIGLGPQTPLEQLGQQRKAKQIVEMDRVMGVLERYPNTYTVQMYEIKDHDNAYYGKREIIIGIPITTQ